MAAIRCLALLLIPGDSEPNDAFYMAAIRCLALLLIPTKTKHSDGDIPYLMKIVPVRNQIINLNGCYVCVVRV